MRKQSPLFEEKGKHLIAPCLDVGSYKSIPNAPIPPPPHPKRICQEVIWSTNEFWKLKKVASEKCMAQLIIFTLKMLIDKVLEI